MRRPICVQKTWASDQSKATPNGSSHSKSGGFQNTQRRPSSLSPLGSNIYSTKREKSSLCWTNAIQTLPTSRSMREKREGCCRIWPQVRESSRDLVFGMTKAFAEDRGICRHTKQKGLRSDRKPFSRVGSPSPEAGELTASRQSSARWVVPPNFGAIMHVSEEAVKPRAASARATTSGLHL